MRVLIAAALAALALAGCASAHHGQAARSHGYTSCVISGGSPSGGSPHVTVTNTGSVPIPVESLPVAVLGPSGQEVASVYVTALAEVEPGQSMTFSDDQGQWSPSWSGCRVVS